MSKSRNTQKLEVDGLDSVSTCTSFVFSFPVFLPTLIPVSHEVSKLARPKPTAKNDSSLQQSRADDMPVRGSLSFFFFLAALGLRCCMRAFSSCGEQGLLFLAVHGLIAVASLVVEHGL